VSLTCILCKVMESIIHEHIMAFFTTHGLISKAQHGFLKRRGCATNLLETRDILTEAIHLGFSADVIYTDFAKAFDKVPHHLLLHKLSLSGIRGGLFEWIKAWLLGRKQRVVIGKNVSEWKSVTSGVPQGSVLGPLFFLVYINDLPTAISPSRSDTGPSSSSENSDSLEARLNNCHVKLYADDSKLIRVIRSQMDAVRLQNDIDAAVEWSHIWQLPFNVDKCKVMHVGKRSKLTHEYTMLCSDGSRRRLEVIKVERDLGVMVSDDLKVRAQVEAAAARANSELGRLKKAFHSRGCFLWRTLYLTYIRPHLEYAVQTWAPDLKGDIDLLQKVQDRVTKIITCFKGMSEESRSEALGLTSLQTRRERCDLLEQFKIDHELVDVEFFVPRIRYSTEYNFRDTHNRRYKAQKFKSNDANGRYSASSLTE